MKTASGYDVRETVLNRNRILIVTINLDDNPETKAC